jgi:fructokinase
VWKCSINGTIFGKTRNNVEKQVTIRLGIDLGGTKIEGIALNDSGKILSRHRIGTPQDDYDGTVRAIGDVVTHIAAQSGASENTPVGIGIPGAISPKTGKIKNANSTCLIGHALDLDLQTLIKRPIRLANDADCFVISEAVDGAGVGATTVFGVILGTGVGGGIVSGGKLIQGPNAIAGEWGHNPLPWMQTLADGHDERPGHDCYCGRVGCIETFVSGTGLARDHKLVNGGSLAAVDVVQKATNGDQSCIDTMERFEHRLSRALTGIINILDPDVIVLGGGLSNVEHLYEKIPQLWQNWVFSDHTDTKLLKNVHGDSSGVRGAAWLWD